MEGSDGLYEISVSSGNNIFRIFCFFDEGQLIILLNGFQKKDTENTKVRNWKSNKIKNKILWRQAKIN